MEKIWTDRGILGRVRGQNVQVRGKIGGFQYLTNRAQVGQRPEIWQISKGHNNSINALKIKPPCFQTEYKVLVRTKKNLDRSGHFRAS